MPDLLTFLLLILPAYVANAVPVLLGGGMPMDFGKNFFDGKRILGDNKTIRGFFAGIFSGIIAGGAIAFLHPVLPLFQHVLSAFFLSFGTMCGDALGSFIKRRIGAKPGTYAIFDSFLFILFALLFAYPFLPSHLYSPLSIVFVLILTFALHILSNFLANRMGWKNVPW
ncbi:MAG: CDP-2,3-bis-(O-geranylgeranyl)-sn-glycerol synthase [Candidatus Anstonellales archaeon]